MLRCVKSRNARGLGAGDSGDRLRGLFRLFFRLRRAEWSGVAGPEMPVTPRADPELFRSPRCAGRWILHLHLRSAALTADAVIGHRHGRDSITVAAMPMPAVVLAAGRSTRMGQPKALLPATRAGETFIERLVNALIAGGIDDVVVVAGDVAAAIRTRLGFRARVVANPDVDRGRLSSIVVGLDVVDRPGVLAVMIAPVDQPLVSETTVGRLLTRGAGIARSCGRFVRDATGIR